MPQCPHCQNPYDQGQRYCSVCGSFLLHPEQGDTFCPQCGVRVSPRQQFCHECDAPLKEEAIKAAQALAEAPRAEPAPEPPPPQAPQGLPTWIIGALAAAGVIIVILLILLFSKTAPPPAPPAAAPKAAAPAPAVTPPPAAAPAPAPVTAAEQLKGQLQGVLNVLREAQLKKNLAAFMSVYSATFPDYNEKREETTEAWENYDFVNLVFTVDKVQSIDANNALAWVTWYMDLRNRKNQAMSSATQTYQVRFVKELGNWRIRQIEEVE
jgi:hypothetical protein